MQAKKLSEIYQKLYPIIYANTEKEVKNKTLKNSGYQYTFDNKNYNSDLKKWCKEMMWWGRRNMQHQSKVL